jgi:hypothetical protein
MTAAIDEEIAKRVRNFWATNPHLSARAVAKEYPTRYRDDNIKERKIIEIVSEAKKAAPRLPFSYSEWEAWADPAESPEETYFLLLLSHIKQVECGLPLYTHEAKWGKRLRVGLNGLDPYGQYKLVSLYATRQVINYYLGGPDPLKQPKYSTADLDAFVMFKPWLPHHNWAAYYRYLVALEAEVVPFPEVDPRPGLGETIDPTAMPEVQWPQGPGPVEYPDLDRRLKDALLWLLVPRTPLEPDRESDPQKRELLELLRHSWTYELETSQFVQDSQRVQALLMLLEERYAKEQEHPSQGQLVRP